MIFNNKTIATFFVLSFSMSIQTYATASTLELENRYVPAELCYMILENLPPKELCKAAIIFKQSDKTEVFYSVALDILGKKAVFKPKDLNHFKSDYLSHIPTMPIDYLFIEKQPLKEAISDGSKLSDTVTEKVPGINLNYKCLTTDELNAFGLFKCTNLTFLGLRGNDMNDEDVKTLLHLRLPFLNSLTDLDLMKNKIGDEGAKALAFNLPYIKTLYLTLNKSISEETKDEILEHISLEVDVNF